MLVLSAVSVLLGRILFISSVAFYYQVVYLEVFCSYLVLSSRHDTPGMSFHLPDETGHPDIVMYHASLAIRSIMDRKKRDAEGHLPEGQRRLHEGNHTSIFCRQR